MRKVLFDLAVLNRLVAAINTQLTPRKYRLKEIPGAIEEIFTKKLYEARDEYRKLIYGPIYSFTDKHGLIKFVGANGFHGRTDIREIELSECLSLGENAFRKCQNLRKIVLPKCSSVGYRAFRDCVSLVSVEGLPSGGSHAPFIFQGCIALSSISLDWSYLDAGMFLGCTNLHDANFPNAMEIKEAVFRDCTQLTNISLPLVSRIRGEAFNNCINLEELSLPELITTGYHDLLDIASYVFSGCRKLKTVYAPKYETMWHGDFKNCTSLENIYMPALSYITGEAFENCISLSNIYSSTFLNVQTLDMSAFQNCISLEYAEFPNAVLVGANNFMDCHNLQAIKIYGSWPTYQDNGSIIMPSLPNSAFYNCYSLHTIEYPEVYFIGQDAFYNCSNLRSINLPHCSRIGNQAFYNCIALSYVSCDQIQWIGASAFTNCSALEFISSLSNCSILESHAFENCNNLSQIEFPILSDIGWTSVYDYNWQGQYTFLNCSKLRLFNAPNMTYDGGGQPTQTGVAKGMFENCINLETVQFSTSYTAVGARMFYNCSSLQSINLPTCTYILSQAFMNCISLSEIDIPNCTYLGMEAFKNCYNLETVRIGAVGIDLMPFSSCFENCSSLKSVVFLRSSLFSLGPRMFANCIALEAFEHEHPLRLGSALFAGCTNLQIVSLPAGLITGSWVFYNCINLEEVHVGGYFQTQTYAYNLTYVFANCSKLKKLYLNSFVEYISASSWFYSCSFLDEGDLYVPSSLYSQFLYSRYNWLTVMDESRIHPI